ncbi:hypothetical protein A6F68_02660 [Tsuneonella dongtanensis]|uniref:Uncharacterized protein n=1 Tax=Tsuneonella dongtanensis TaxID=692370 RepID=A0A1B2AG88_9SPHN|nr:hypothetical protein [Tsuneonella dongtanensis]ANY21154.1 hypothetical protein A6F68_02660 [Tsuneonella dongtanensis]
MDQSGLEQVKERLARLQAAAAVIASSAPTKDRVSAWLDFLQFHGTIYSKLEQAAKSAPESKDWFQTKRAERKSDDLLKYLHHARNVGEHTIQKAASQATWAISGKVSDAGIPAFMGFKFDAQGKPVPESSGMKDVTIHENEVLLNAVVDRGVTYYLPKEHAGQPIKGSTAKEIAALALHHAESMVEEAAALT